MSRDEVIRNAVDAFDESLSQEDAALMDTMADAMIKSTQETISRIDRLMQRMDETHAMVMGDSHRDR